MISLKQSISVVLSVAALTLQGVSPSLGQSVSKEQAIAQQTTVVEITELTIKPSLSKEQEEKMVKIDQDYQPKLEAALKTYGETVKSFEDLLVGLKQKLGPNIPQTRFVSGKDIPIFS